jgi:hypothetical protein
MVGPARLMGRIFWDENACVGGADGDLGTSMTGAG